MPISNFVPELWSAAVQVPHEEALVFGQSAVSNRQYEGELRQQGDTVHVTSIDDPTVQSYDKNTDLEVEDLNDSRISLTVDQGDYFAFRVNDVDEVQAVGDFRSPATNRAGYKLAAQADTFLASLFVEDVATGGPVAENRISGIEVPVVEPDKRAGGQLSAYQLIVKLRELLDKKSVPTPGRYAIVNPEFISALSLDDRFTDLSARGSSETLLNGQVSVIQGFNLLVSNRLPVVGGETAIIAGVPEALSYVNQINQVEAIRDQKRFADIVRGYNIYGGKIFRREDVATALVTIVDEGESN